MQQFEMMPRGPFSLEVVKQYFGDWTTLGPDQTSLRREMGGPLRQHHM